MTYITYKLSLPLPLPMVAHGSVVTSSRQITQIKQHQARLVLD